MTRTPLLTAVTLFALAGAAFAGPAPHEMWASGKIARVDGAARSVVVSQGKHEMTFVLSPKAQLMQGKKSLSATDLNADVGRAVKVRYSISAGSKVADRMVIAAKSAAARPGA